MTTLNTVMDTVYLALSGDVTLQGYLGGTTNVYMGWVNQNSIFPCVTVFPGNESSDKKFGYDFSASKVNSPTVQIDIWIDKNHLPPLPCTSRDLHTIATYVDKVIMQLHITDTWGWRRSSYPEQQENSVLTTLFHKTMTYQFQYNSEDD